jgi:hypothetical protein
LSQYEQRDLHGRRQYPLTEIELELSRQYDDPSHRLRLYELRTALAETEAAITSGTFTDLTVSCADDDRNIGSICHPGS